MSTPSDPGTPHGEPKPDPAHPAPWFAADPAPGFATEPPSESPSGSPPGPPTRASARKRRRIFTIKHILLTMLALFLIGAAAVGVAYAKVSVPQPNQLANAQASIIYYSDGKTEMARISEINRESVPLSQIPPHVQQALLAAEDRAFYQEHGVSPTGIGRAMLVALKGGPTQGGSTITQQYVKNYFLTQDRTVSRKAKEFIISIKIDQEESKSTILANYLNTIYYGRGAYGIQTAAKAYFGKDVSKLTVGEGALLASVIRGPSYYDPGLGASQKKAATDRVNYVLDGMVSQGWLTPAARAKVTFPATIAKTRTTKVGTVGYLVQEVKNELRTKLNLSVSDIDRGGLRIVTTIDRRAQKFAIEAVMQNMPSAYSSTVAKGKALRPQTRPCIEDEAQSGCDALHVGLTAIRPRDGAIVALYGGKDYAADQYNSSTQATMQGGSTFKVFGMLAALQKEISTKTRYDGHSPRYMKQFVSKEFPRGKVSNFGNEQFGNIDLRKALAHSVNTVFAQLNVDLAAPGTQATGVRDAAVLAGIPKGCPGNTVASTCTPALSTNINNIFGTASVHVIDMANAYATIAAQGQKATPYIITRVTSPTGLDYKVKKKLTPAFDKSVTADVTDAMTRVVQEGTGKAAKSSRPAAGKTGTTTENKAVWFDGFTPQLAAAVGIYQGDGTASIKVKGIDEVTGGGPPTKIWAAFMEGALYGIKTIDFPPRVGVGDSKIPPPPPPPTTAAPSPTTTFTQVPTPTFTNTGPPTPSPTRTRRTRPGPTPTGPPTTGPVP